MPNDIFVDANVAKNFSNPLDKHYKDFVDWLIKKGFLIVTQKIIAEYVGASGASTSLTNIGAIIERLQRDGRLVRFSKTDLDAFRIPPHIRRKLRSNKKDHNHIRAVLLSHRKYAISYDKNFRYDVNHFPGVRAIAVARPEELPYEKGKDC